MYKKTVTYENYNGEKITEDFFFNLTKAELTMWEHEIDGGLGEALNTALKSKNVPALMKAYEELLMRSYGEKSADGKRFIKSKELSEAFSQTPAYDIIFMELIEDEKEPEKFIKAVLPEVTQQDDKHPAKKTTK